MPMIITQIAPMPIQFNPHLLSLPTWGFSTKNLIKISDFLQKKIDSAKFNKFPATIKKLKQKQQQFMELYERAKTKERETKEKTCIKTNAPFYRPRFANCND